MDDTITTIYCVCEELLKAMGLRDDPQAQMTTAEVMTVALVASAFFGGNVEKSRLFLSEHGYMERMLSKSRLNRRLHAIDADLWRALFGVLAELFKERSDDTGLTWWIPCPSRSATTSASSDAAFTPAGSMGRPFVATSPPNAAISTGSGCIWS